MHEDQLVVVVLLLLPLPKSFSITVKNNQCTIFYGEVTNINYLFRLKGDPKICSNPHYELTCRKNHTILNLYLGKYYERFINYANHTIRVADVGLRKGNCSSFPRHSLSCTYSSYEWKQYTCWRRPYEDDKLSRNVAVVDCTRAINSPLYVDTSSCFDGVKFSNFSSMRRRVYAMVNVSVLSVETTCTIKLMAMIPQWVDRNDLRSYVQIHEQMTYGFEFSWLKKACISKVVVHAASTLSAKFIAEKLSLVAYSSSLAGNLLFIGLLTMGLAVYGIEKSHILNSLAFSPKYRGIHDWEIHLGSPRYSYLDIKKIAIGLKDKLGEGGYGFVFKGRLRSDHDVAVKILKKGKANGQDFIDEVATIERIHHFNVVGLIGFCFEGSKQALIYNFMHNGSLDKHIFSQGEGTCLDFKEVYKIALGVARGIDYLHRGCNIQILHFDIKPHNILLVSNFGLTRLYSPNHNTVSLTTVRGTLGYVAPEMIYKNIGSISYKADVYSFGKLLMEVVSRRKNADAVAKYSSQIYFSLWVHDQLSEGSNVPTEEVSEEDTRIVKNMIIVALWCIQLNPSDHPSMCKALEMLEGEANDLQVPPKSLFYPTCQQGLMELGLTRAMILYPLHPLVQQLMKLLMLSILVLVLDKHR
ncbi:hypothetical protein BT93_K2090 [Corymbia citriodora subsp. variegata]|nr:hypothetical protein BT93_K2090 [Corymbia citriodora subsp. variegata]